MAGIEQPNFAMDLSDTVETDANEWQHKHQVLAGSLTQQPEIQESGKVAELEVATLVARLQQAIPGSSVFAENWDEHRQWTFWWNFHQNKRKSGDLYHQNKVTVRLSLTRYSNNGENKIQLFSANRRDRAFFTERILPGDLAAGSKTETAIFSMLKQEIEDGKTRWTDDNQSFKANHKYK